MMKNKKGAIELSIGTIVIIVLAMSMLIMGLVLVRNIFQGATYNVEQLNKNVESEINKLFNERGENIVLYLPSGQAEVKQGKSFGIAFGIKNTVSGESTSGKFSYKIQSSSIQKGCKLTNQEADSYLKLGDTGSFDLLPGKTHPDLVKIQPSSSAPLCEVKYTLSVTKDGQPYADSSFIIVVVS
jgi:hypothetical protein